LDQVCVVLLDNHEPAGLDIVTERLFSRNCPVRRLAQLSSPILFSRAVFVPPGYSSILYAWTRCLEERNGLLWAFAAFALDSFEVEHRLSRGPLTQRPRPDAVSKVRIVFQVRRPYPGRATVSRRIGNENALLQVLENMQDLVDDVKMVEFGALSWREQMKVVAGCDLLIGA